ncbi:MAG: hypothetical protein J6C50_02645 [Rickettsiales bacterium]|nr:hypothetical protein [Rickettsiales bacterium]
MFKTINKYIKSKLPKTIFYRFVLIVLLPLFLMQIAFFIIFFNRYWDTTLTQNIDLLSNEIFILNTKYDELYSQNINKNIIIDKLNIFTNNKINFIKNTDISNNTNYNDYFIKTPLKQLTNKLQTLNINNINLYKTSNEYYNIEIEKEDGFLVFTIQKDRIFIKRIDLILFWNITAFCIISTIALLFIKNQVRSIKKLEKFANDFSYLEKDNSNFKPTGAKEIREMGEAFIKLVKRIRQLIFTRTTMLAQISHDLRTPLTRMKLQAEFIEDEETANFFKQDLEEMEKMINEYLLFAKGEMENDFKQVNIQNFFNEIINDYKRGGYIININYNLKIRGTYLKIDSFKRCINNLINNALKYYKKNITIKVKTTKNTMIINIEDDGCGIPEEFINKVKVPFFKINKNEKSKNVGLGLSIVQNVINMHKGKIIFKESKDFGGLNVELNIPIIKNKRSLYNVK